MSIPDGQNQRRRGTSAGLLPCTQGSFPDTGGRKCYKSVQWWALFSFSSKENVRTCRATTASWGSSGSGAARSACIKSTYILYMVRDEWAITSYCQHLILLTWTLRSTVRRVIAAAHWSFRMSRQIAPVTLDTFGCQILVINRTWRDARSSCNKLR